MDKVMPKMKSFLGFGELPMVSRGVSGTGAGKGSERCGKPNGWVVNHREIGTGTGYGMSSAGSVVLDFASVCTRVVRSSPTTTLFAPIEQTLFHLFHCSSNQVGVECVATMGVAGSSGVPVAAPIVTSALRVGDAPVGGCEGDAVFEGKGLAWFGGDGSWHGRVVGAVPRPVTGLAAAMTVAFGGG
jgi:hypothetical protein